MELGSHWTDFDETWYFSFFLKKVFRESSGFVKIRQEERVLYMKTFHTYDNISRSYS